MLTSYLPQFDGLTGAVPMQLARTPVDHHRSARVAHGASHEAKGYGLTASLIRAAEVPTRGLIGLLVA
jgi:hypothetical protein